MFDLSRLLCGTMSVAIQWLIDLERKKISGNVWFSDTAQTTWLYIFRSTRAVSGVGWNFFICECVTEVGVVDQPQFCW